MTYPTAESPLQNTARLAGLLWLLNVFTTYLTLGYVRPAVIVSGDAAATAANIVALEPLFRVGIASTLVTYLLMYLFGLTVYHLFTGVNRVWEMVFLTSTLITVTIGVVNALNSLGALIVLSGVDYMQVFSPEQRNALAMVLVRLGNSGQALLELFWVPFYFSFGWLILRSRYLPRVLGILLLLMSLGFLLNTFTKILVPDFNPAQFTLLAQMLGALGGVPTILWLLIRGAKAQPVAGK